MTFSSTFSLAVLLTAVVAVSGCSLKSDKVAAQNSLHQQTGDAGSTVPRSSGSYYPNTAGNIVSPPGNPGGNPPGAPPIVGGNMSQQGEWP
ncbi:MAG TPA: hypothetical protein VIU63_04975 [Nitrospira sp.]